MKDSTDFSFLIKVLALAILLIAGYSKEDLLPSFDADEERFEPLNSELDSSVYFSPLTTPEATSNLVSLTSKK